MPGWGRLSPCLMIARSQLHGTASAGQGWRTTTHAETPSLDIAYEQSGPPTGFPLAAAAGEAAAEAPTRFENERHARAKESPLWNFKKQPDSIGYVPTDCPGPLLLAHGANRSEGASGYTSMTRVKDRYGQMAKGRMASLELRQNRAHARATAVAPVIAELQAAGVTSLSNIAKALNARGIPTVTGKSEWRYYSVRRVLAQLKPRGPAGPTGLGPYPELTVAMARERAAEARHLVKGHKDSYEALAVARAWEHGKAPKTMTFKQCAEKMHAHRTHWGRNYTSQWFIMLSTYAFPVIGNLPVATINTGLVLNVLEPIWASRTDTASRLRGRIEKVLDWAKARDYRNGKNPARWRGHLEHFLSAPANILKVGHHAALPFDQIPHFMTVLRAQKGPAARALEFLILTVRRRDEVIGARWNEIDSGEKIWIVPAERMKGGREHRVPLSARAIEILEEMKTDDSFVFGGGHRQLGAAMFRLLRRLRDGRTEQGFLFTFREWATERAGFPREVVEIALAHTVDDEVGAAYGGDELINRQRELMDAWATACSGRALRSLD